MGRALWQTPDTINYETDSLGVYDSIGGKVCI